MKPDDVRTAVIDFARNYDYEVSHSHHVAKLSVMLFDGLEPLHHLQERDRRCLEYAALLHDIGWTLGQKAHHKNAMHFISEDRKLPLSNEDRIRIALLARYHRKALPKDTHPLYEELNENERHKVCILGGILRLADGLDRAHMERVQNVHCTMDEKQVTVIASTSGSGQLEQAVGTKKSDLLERALGRWVRIQILHQNDGNKISK